MILESYELAKAVVFFVDNQITKAMLYTEFEAVLDGFVPAVEFANMGCKAAYVEIDSSLDITSVVFFRVSFGPKGEIDPAWNLPLDQLAAMSEPRPDLTLSHLRLACESHCPLPFFQQHLWEPDFSKGNKQLAALKHFSKNNRLAIRFRSVVSTEAPSTLNSNRLSQESIDGGNEAQKVLQQEYAKEFQAQLKSLRTHAALLKRESQEVIAKLKKDHERRIAEYRELFREKDEQLKALRDRNQRLQDEIDTETKKIAGLCEYYEYKLETQQSDLTDALSQRFEKEMQATSDADIKEYKALLEIRDVEIQNRKNEEATLKEEVAILRQQNHGVLMGNGRALLQKMLSKGISFVHYQPGAGHINIPLEGLPLFMENATAFVAKQCGVSESSYRSWQCHYQAPVCMAEGGGQFCGENIDRCEIPADFESGVTDRCIKHQVFAIAGKLKVVGT